jgi:hypothetical protein
MRTLYICHRLLASLIMDFIPVLFTVCAASHMGCTDIVADRWMTDVITPALADGGVGHPLGTLIISHFCPGTRWVYVMNVWRVRRSNGAKQRQMSLRRT